MKKVALIVCILTAEAPYGDRSRMLVLTRSKGTAVHIGGDIAVTVRDLIPGQAVIQIDYPTELALKAPAGVGAGSPASAAADNGVPPSGPARSRAMLNLRVEDVVEIGEDISVKVVALLPTETSPHRVRLGFTAPRELRISRNDFPHREGPGGSEAGS